MNDDLEWASLASASGLADELDDEDCQHLVATVDAAAADLARRISSRMLLAKSGLAQRGQMRQAQAEARAADEQRRLEGIIDDEVAAREEVEARLEKARLQQHKLAELLSSTRDDGIARLGAQTVLFEWQRSLAAIKREGYCERLAPKHFARTLLRKCVGRWRSAGRKLRHARIDQFWERSVLELRSALLAHYEPKLRELDQMLAASRQETADAHVAKEQLGAQLKAAFMRGVCQLNLETASILGPGGEGGEEPQPDATAPRPIL